MKYPIFFVSVIFFSLLSRTAHFNITLDTHIINFIYIYIYIKYIFYCFKLIEKT